MALTLVKEDGTGLADANSYADVADGDAYFEGHLYATAWTGASGTSKAAALVMATRLIDSQYQFNGVRANEGQALQWPREECRDPDGGNYEGRMVNAECVPAAVVQATCEMARELLIVDRTAAVPGEGIHATQTSQASHTDTSGSSSMSSTTYSKADRRRIISPVARSMLCKYGALLSDGGGVARLVRA